jgi:isopenicillin-N epimerase
VSDLCHLFLLDPDIIFLNHGSFGACPRPVFEAYQAWQLRLERQPVLFLGREFPELDRQARQSLSAYLGANADDLVYVPNATHGVNIVARSLHLEPGDEILTSDHEYGACDNTWRFLCQKSRARYLHQPIPLPVRSAEEIVEIFWQGVTPRTRLIFLSHLTSSTALRLPIEAICARAREVGILTLIDGAHAPGQINLGLPATGADFYTGNLHKWMMAPKGAAFLHARPEVQTLVEPLVVSWGYSATPETTCGSAFVDQLTWTGTRDPAAALSVPAAIEFMQHHHWEEVRQACHDLLRPVIERLTAHFGLVSFYPDPPQGFFYQMGAVPLPDKTDVRSLKTRLYEEFRVEVPLIEWNGRKLMRISVQGYNTQADLDRLVQAVEALVPR